MAEPILHLLFLAQLCAGGVLAFIFLSAAASHLYSNWERRLKTPGEDQPRDLGAERDPVIKDTNHPLWSFGARRGPEPPADLPTHTATGRFR